MVYRDVEGGVWVCMGVHECAWEFSAQCMGVHVHGCARELIAQCMAHEFGVQIFSAAHDSAQEVSVQ